MGFASLNPSYASALLQSGPTAMPDTSTRIDERLAAYRRMVDLGGKTALVVGAASGIGKASAEALAAFGATVICADVDEQAVKETAAGIGGEAHLVDAGKSEDIRRLAGSI